MARYEDLSEKNVLITGGANGIGEAMVRAFANQGARVAFCDLDAPGGESLARELGESVRFTRVDLRREASVKRWVQSAGKSRGRIDVLVNNAASDPRIPLAECTVKRWDDLFASNLRAMFLTVREARPWFPKTGASVINFSSMTFFEGPADMSAYVAGKGGIIGLSRSLARELGPDRVRVNAIAPGWIMTERQKRMFVTPKVARRIREGQCIPDLLQPEEIAEVALFLASGVSGAITGQTLLADRGWHHH